MKARSILLPALLLWTYSASVRAEQLNLPGLNVNLGLNAGALHANVNVTPPVVHVNVPTPSAPVNLPPVSLPVQAPVSVPVSMPVSAPASMPPAMPVAMPMTTPAATPTHSNFSAVQFSPPTGNTQIPTFHPSVLTAVDGNSNFKTLNGIAVQVDKNAPVLVSRDSKQTRILNITGVTQSVRISDPQGRQHIVKLDPGRELVTSKEALSEQDVRVPDGVARRNVNVIGNIATSEIDLGSLLKTNGELRRLVLNPATAAERKLGNQLLKTAASLLTVRGGNGFQQAPPPALPPPVVAGGGSGSSVATQTVTGALVGQSTQNQAANQAQQVNQSAVAANPRVTNTFDQTHPLLSTTFQRLTSQEESAGRPRRIAQVPPILPAALPGLSSNLPASVGTNHETRHDFPGNAAPQSAAGSKGRGGNGAADNAAGDGESHQNGIIAGIHSQLKRTVQRHPTLAIFLIALFGLMFAIVAALAVAFYRTRQEVNRLNRGLQAKVAELNELNDELTRTRDKAIEASRLKSEFVANISHEIRTPITAVLGMIGLLREHPHDKQENELIKMLDESARSLLTVINDILDFSKIEAGMLHIQSVDFRVADVARDTVELLATSAREKNIAFNLQIDPTADRFVHGDPFRLRQVLVNLLGNAIKFTSQGSVTLLVQAEENNAIGFHVKDTGVGISAEARNRLFQPFSQADGTTTRRFGGTGLGLSISRRLVELMDGRIDFDSTPGEGSHFWFTIPFAPAESVPAPAPEGHAASALPTGQIARQRILVAEDSPVLQRVVVHQLKKLHYDVQLVTNGREAVEAIKNERFDLVLMDWQMPELDGIQATKQIRELAEGNSVPIIAMTANAMEGDRLSCLNAGMNDYISKPFTVDDLQKAIETWLPVASEGA